MCLLVVLSRVHPAAPLVVAANRDEWLNRPASPCTVLQEHGPRILGGRDELAGGTWLAVNEHGVFAGLTNQPTPVRDPSRRSRGELPLALVQHPSARAAVEAFVPRHRPADYSPAWLLVGDREALYLVDMTGGAEAQVVELPAGLHVLENRAWGAPSAKVQAVRAQVGAIASGADESLVEQRSVEQRSVEQRSVAQLSAVLRSHQIPTGPAGDSGVAGFVRPPETEANCVHAGPYGTRSSSVLWVARAPARPRLWVSDGPPCTHELLSRDALWLGP
ncbi:MAG: NRDE family protein [Deltaproteobacteria bacterium]|nr:NRDE family protein [Deltaproteobacteria bacterium]